MRKSDQSDNAAPSFSSVSPWSIVLVTVAAAAVWTAMRWLGRRRTQDRRRTHWQGVWDRRIGPASERLAAWTAYRAQERKWGGSLEPAVAEAVAGDVREMNFDGEVYFCLMGLKPCVLFAINQGAAAVDDLVETVAKKVLLPPAVKGMALKQIRHSIVGETGIDWAGAWVLWDRRHRLALAVEDTFFNEQKNTVSDVELARVLDYPGYINGNLKVQYRVLDPL